MTTSSREIMGIGEKAKVMLLGTFHLDSPGLDALNLKVDMMTKQRQLEVEEVVSLLEAFRPTKIAVEAPLDAEGRLYERFQAYRSGAFELTANEIYQLGFRLAGRLGHEKVYPIDAWGRHYDTEEQLAEYARRHGLPDDEIRNAIQTGEWWDRFTKLFHHTEQIIATKTLRESLRFINEEEQVRLSHGTYLAWPDADPGDYNLVDFITGWWYNRNLRIFANLKRITGSPEDRILVIYGYGHLPLLQHAVETSYLHELVDVSTYL